MSDDVVPTGQRSPAVAFQAAVSLFELGLLPTARINEALGLGGESVATVELLLDKWRMRRHLAARGISPVASAVGRSARDVREFVQAHGLPIIVKPIREVETLTFDGRSLGAERPSGSSRRGPDGSWR